MMRSSIMRMERQATLVLAIALAGLPALFWLSASFSQPAVAGAPAQTQEKILILKSQRM